VNLACASTSFTLGDKYTKALYSHNHKTYLISAYRVRVRCVCKNLPIKERFTLLNNIWRTLRDNFPSASSPSGPASITQSASATTSKLCSITRTEYPSFTKRCSAFISMLTYYHYRMGCITIFCIPS